MKGFLLTTSTILGLSTLLLLAISAPVALTPAASAPGFHWAGRARPWWPRNIALGDSISG